MLFLVWGAWVVGLGYCLACCCFGCTLLPAEHCLPGTDWGARVVDMGSLVGGHPSAAAALGAWHAVATGVATCRATCGTDWGAMIADMGRLAWAAALSAWHAVAVRVATCRATCPHADSGTDLGAMVVDMGVLMWGAVSHAVAAGVATCSTTFATLPTSSDCRLCISCCTLSVGLLQHWAKSTHCLPAFLWHCWMLRVAHYFCHDSCLVLHY